MGWEVSMAIDIRYTPDLKSSIGHYESMIYIYVLQYLQSKGGSVSVLCS